MIFLNESNPIAQGRRRCADNKKQQQLGNPDIGVRTMQLVPIENVVQVTDNAGFHQEVQRLIVFIRVVELDLTKVSIVLC